MKKILEMNVDDHGNNGVYSLIRSVIMQKPSDLSIDVACIEPFENKSNIDELNAYGTNVYYVGYAGNKIKKQKVITDNLCRIIAENHYDIVHIHTDIAYKPYVYAKAAKKAGCPRIIIHSHATDAEEPHRNVKRMMHFMTRNKLKNLATDYAACSELAFDWMFPDIDKSKAKIIYNGIDLKKFSFQEDLRNKIRKHYHISENDFVIGHVGRFSYQKNHEFLLKVFKMVHDVCPNVILMLVGDGDQRQQAEQYVKENHLENNVIFTGIQKNPAEFYQAMDLFALPSRFEGFPIVGVEAQASGLPVLFSDQITREAGINPNVDFIGIRERDMEIWKDKMIASMNEKRLSTQKYLKDHKLDINDTLSAFIKLYSE